MSKRKAPEDDESNQKMAAVTTTTVTDLQKLLQPLGESLDLVVLAALSPADSRATDAELSQKVQHANDQAFASLAKVFERTVGPYDEVLGNALRIASWDFDDHLHYVNRRCAGDHPRDDRYSHPTKRYMGAPPQPSVWVWLRLFGGEECIEEIQKKYISEDKCEYEKRDNGMWCAEPDTRLQQLGDIRAKLKTLKDGERWDNGKVPLKAMAGVLGNALRFLRTHAGGGVSAEKLLGFCAQYGLSGAISHIVEGRYGHYGGAWRINQTHEPLKIRSDTGDIDESKDQEDEDRSSIRYCFGGDLKLAPYATAAILGHTNVVRAILKNLGGAIDAECTFISHKAFPVENLPSLLLTWAILSNQPAMVRCLVTEIGFQFRWLEEDDLYDIWRNLHETSPYEHTRWMTIMEDPYDWAGMRELRGRRARNSFVEKDKMFKLLINLGLPKDLLFPDGADFSMDKEFLDLPEHKRKEPSKEDISRYEEWQKSLPASVKHARDLIFNACITFNSVQPLDATEEDYYPMDEDDNYESSQQSKKLDKLTSTLHAHQYYEKMVDAFDKQDVKQDARLSEYEQRDPRWTSPDEYVRKEYKEEEYDY